MRITNFISI